MRDGASELSLQRETARECKENGNVAQRIDDQKQRAHLAEGVRFGEEHIAYIGFRASER